MFGFRKGRSCHDAIALIRPSIQFGSKWVLDADIEKFFDRVNHEALLEKLNTFPTMREAIRRLLKSGVLEGTVLTPSEEGTPQGGVLSPLLANIVLCGMEESIKTESRKWVLENGRRPKRDPVVAIYADDFVVLHESREVIERTRELIAAWLDPMGLQLHPEKTRIAHTRDEHAGQAGFDFLGHHIQQFKTGKYALKGCFKQTLTLIVPSKKATKSAVRKAAEIIDEMLSQPAGKTRISQPSNEEILIHRLNRFIRGWTGFFRHANSKRTFSKLDHLLWWKLWKALKRRYREKGREWIVDAFFNGGSRWQFNCPTKDPTQKAVLIGFAETPITRHVSVKKEASIFDGQWSYWGARLGEYPSIPAPVCRLLKRQRGACSKCRGAIQQEDRVEIVKSHRGGPQGKATRQQLVHARCVSAD